MSHLSAAFELAWCGRFQVLGIESSMLLNIMVSLFWRSRNEAVRKNWASMENRQT